MRQPVRARTAGPTASSSLDASTSAPLPGCQLSGKGLGKTLRRASYGWWHGRAPLEDHSSAPGARRGRASRGVGQVVRGQGRGPGRNRQRQAPARDRQVKVRLSTGEWEAIATAARIAGLTPSGYVAEVAVAAAAGSAVSLRGPLRWALAEVISTRAVLGGVGARLERATGSGGARELGPQAPGPQQVVEEARQAVARLDTAASAILRSLP